MDAVSIPGGHAASICDNTSEAICRVLEEEEESAIEIHEFEVEREFLYWRHFPFEMSGHYWYFATAILHVITFFSTKIVVLVAILNNASFKWMTRIPFFRDKYSNTCINCIKWEITRNLTSYEKSRSFSFFIGLSAKEKRTFYWIFSISSLVWKESVQKCLIIFDEPKGGVDNFVFKKWF